MALWRSREDKHNVKTRPIVKSKSIVATANGKADKHDDEEEEEMTEKEGELTHKLALAEAQLAFHKEMLNHYVKANKELADKLDRANANFQDIILKLIEMKGVAPVVPLPATVSPRASVASTPNVSTKLPG